MHDLPLPLDVPVDLPVDAGAPTLPDLPTGSGYVGVDSSVGSVGGGLHGTDLAGGVDTPVGGVAGDVGADGAYVATGLDSPVGGAAGGLGTDGSSVAGGVLGSSDVGGGAAALGLG